MPAQKRTEQLAPMAVNIRRLIFFHHRSQREAAHALGVSEHTVSRWLTGKTEPDGQALMRMAEVYGINPYRLNADPTEFAKDLADAERMKEADRQILEALESGQAIDIVTGKPVQDLDT
jgi:transcriptional regulator with XRE-family HTH domain